MKTSAAPEALPFRLEREVMIHALPDLVFRYFTDSSRFATWWGPGSTIDARPGGAVYIRHPGGVESLGEVLEISAPRRIVFTYGFASGTPIPPGSSRVTITLEPRPTGTPVHVLHELADEQARDDHVQGWRFQMSVFANVVADEANADAARRVDAWFGAWGQPDAATREREIGAIAATHIRFHDRFSSLDGLSDVLAHLTAAQRFMPGLRMRRLGEVRHCQGMVLADWLVASSDGTERGRGTNAFVFGPSGSIDWVTGFWSPPSM